MYVRLLEKPLTGKKSFFLFGPRGTGKTSWLRSKVSDCIYLDLLEAQAFNKFVANPERLELSIPTGYKHWIIIDEVQKVPALLDEVHRLIEKYRYKFVLTGSSARKLRHGGVNLLAGRALTYFMHPLTAIELGKDFNLKRAILYGGLPGIITGEEPLQSLASYVQTYLYQEVQQEGLTRNLENFARFLESASFSQGSLLNISAVARECSVHRRLVASYFEILDDLLIGYQLPPFTKRSKRRLVAHPKFYFFDVGVFRSIRPQGPLDLEEEIDGPALETLFLQQLRAINDYFSFNYKLYYWRTGDGAEVDFIAYGPNGMHAFEIKRSNRWGESDLHGLKILGHDYPVAQRYLVYLGNKTEYFRDIKIVPIQELLFDLPNVLEKK
ncbi:MAG: AAA family ATPase [Gammaproteobacteria bacterium]